MQFEDNTYPDACSRSEFLAKVARSRGYAAALDGAAADRQQSAEWLAGWQSAADVLAMPFSAPVHNRLPKIAYVSPVAKPALPKPKLSGPTGPVAKPVSAGPVSTGKVLIVDYMNLLVRAFHAGAPSRIHAVRGMMDTMRLALGRTNPEFVIFAMDGGHAERTRLLPSYKAHRPEKPIELVEQIELGHQAIRAMGWPSIRVIDWEADDVVASLTTQLAGKCEVIICSSDKDLLQLLEIPGVNVYHPWDGGKMCDADYVRSKFNVNPNQVADCLALTGDSSDGIPGVEGVGPKKAADLLQKFGTLAGILDAAKRSQISGVLGTRLISQADNALLSRRLVALQTDLPVGEHWKKHPVRTPRSGWQYRLQEIGLVAIAQRLAELLENGVERPDDSHAEIEWGVIDSFAPVTMVPVEVQSAAVETCPDPKVICQEITPANGDEVEWSTPIVPELGHVRTNEGAGSKCYESSDPSTWYPNLMACPVDAPLIDKVRAIWRVGFSHFEAGREVPNSWRSDTAYFAAMAEGLAGQHLSIDLKKYDSDGMLVIVDHLSAPSGSEFELLQSVTHEQHRRIHSLF